VNMYAIPDKVKQLMPDAVVSDTKQTTRFHKRRLPNKGIRKWLYDQIVSGTPVILSIQKYRHPVLDAYFKFSTFCGDKLFYVSFFDTVEELSRRFRKDMLFYLTYVDNINPLFLLDWRCKIRKTFYITSHCCRLLWKLSKRTSSIAKTSFTSVLEKQEGT